jgi:hypothetical protein
MEPRKERKSRFKIEKLEDRIAPAHLGEIEVFLPPQASHGEPGLNVVADKPPTHETPNGDLVPHIRTRWIILAD